MKNVYLHALLSTQCMSSYLLIPMDDAQSNHLKAMVLPIGLENKQEVDWLLITEAVVF